MTDKFFIELNDLLEKCDLPKDEKEFLEELAEFMVFPDRDPNKDPRNVFARSIKALKDKRHFIEYKNLIYNYQNEFKNI
jgi:hypothetical protein